MEFQWDKRKAESNLKKHGVSFVEASSAFGDSLSLTINDPSHSDKEVRFILIGRSFKNRPIVVVHTDREDSIRIISARHATKREIAEYES